MQSDYRKPLQEGERAYASLQNMFEVTRQENRALGEQVKHLGEQVLSLSRAKSERTERLAKQVTALSEQVEGLSKSVRRWTPEAKRR
ncbi:MbeD/MobD family mobilization/exclusion protein [Acinetobacter baumannii]|uniref:MbeD/MobD family mobilization/exclusion protein n=1 Tax=Acinetobacter baumannii TaxID=470 RepID=UPI001F2B8191|nr:MbeD/MobD family mobilization/exclusion protein [Acinetobacter baumannii]MCF7227627.1 hypothetical protein [Acinetobacter baumannii]